MEAAKQQHSLQWLEEQVSAICCRHNGSPSYDHDAYWMKERVLNLVREAKYFSRPSGIFEGAAKSDLIQALEIVLEREQITSATRALIEQTLRRAKGG